jgi:hypothetical protein
MVAMQMADKNMVDPTDFLFEPAQLHLGPFTAVD